MCSWSMGGRGQHMHRTQDADRHHSEEQEQLYWRLYLLEHHQYFNRILGYSAGLAPGQGRVLWAHLRHD